MDKTIVETQIVKEIRRRILFGEYPQNFILPNQRTLAKEFKTSPTTVSRALNKIKEQGYIEMVQGRGTKVLPVNNRPDRGRIGILYPYTSSLSEEASEIYKGIISALGEYHQHYTFITGDVEHKIKIKKLLHKQFSGFIFIEAYKMSPLFPFFNKMNIPYVVANLEEEFDVPCTWVDHSKITYNATIFLAALGHCTIGLVSRPIEYLFFSKALEGYKKALKTLNYPYEKKNILILKSSKDSEEQNRIKDFISGNRHITGFVCTRDWMAYKLCKSFRDLNIKIGFEVSVVGFDDISWPEEKSYLTTFKEPAFEMGYQAVKLLIEEMILPQRFVIKKREIEVPMILRTSAGLPLSLRHEKKEMKFNTDVSIFFNPKKISKDT